MEINKILEKHRKSECPDIVLLAKSLGFTVRLVDLNHSLFRSIMNNKEILINLDVAVSSRKFLVAYHLSEFILKGEEISIIYMDALYDKEIYEYAVDLLIPNKKLKCIDIESEKYNVSPSIILNKINRKNRR